MNLGLSEKVAFSDITPIPRPVVINSNIPDPQWLAGFATGESCFLVEIKKYKLNLGFQVCLSFTLTQHFRDEQLMRSLIKYLNCGNIIRRQSENTVDFKVTILIIRLFLSLKSILLKELKQRISKTFVKQLS